MKSKIRVILSLVAGCGMMAAGAAHAGVSINVGNAVSPTFVAPAPAATMAPGWHGDRYYDGHRTGERKDWEAHQRMEQEHRDARHDDRHEEHVRRDAEHRDDHAGHQDHGVFHHQG